MEEDSDSVSASGVGGIIPFFFYDAIAKIIPGAFLIAGILITASSGGLLVYWPKTLQDDFPKDSGSGYSTVVVMLFLAMSYFLGTILGHLSHLCIERLWRLFCPLNRERLAWFIGANNLEILNSRFEKKFGIDLTDKNLNEASFLCSYFVWTVNQDLGAMTARIDAESLAAQSCTLVSFGLTVAAWLTYYYVRANPFGWIWATCVSVITLGAILGFHHLRKRRLFGRFAQFLTTSVENTRHAAHGVAVEKSQH